MESPWVIYRAKCIQFGGNRGLEPFTELQSSISENFENFFFLYIFFEIKIQTVDPYV